MYVYVQLAGISAVRGVDSFMSTLSLGTTVNLLKPIPPQRFSAAALLPLLYTVESKSLRLVPGQSPASSTEWPFVRESHEFTKYEMNEYERKAIPTIKTIGPTHSQDASKMMSFLPAIIYLLFDEARARDPLCALANNSHIGCYD